MIHFADANPSNASIKVVGVGGAGGNAVNAMINADVTGVDFIAINTDLQALTASLAPRKIQVGKNKTRGLGAGANPEIGEEAVIEDKDEIINALTDADMVFITAGMGGGTGTGGAHILAEIAKNMGALTVAIVTKPFTFEGPQRRKKADAGIEKLKSKVDTLIIIPNDRLIAESDRNTPIFKSFMMADNVLLQATRGISDLIVNPGYINLDFADVKAIMSDMGDALMGCGVASGQDRAIISAQQAISSPLLEGVSIDGALGVLINICGSKESMTMQEITDASTLIQDQAGENANVIFGISFDETLGEEIRITVIATGFNADAKNLKKLQEEKRTVPEKKEIKTAFIKKAINPIQYKEKPDNQLHMPLIEKELKEIVAEEEKSLEDEIAHIRKENSIKRDIKLNMNDIDIPTYLRKQMD
jgi:cell division protein FtsZ